MSDAHTHIYQHIPGFDGALKRLQKTPSIEPGCDLKDCVLWLHVMVNTHYLICEFLKNSLFATQKESRNQNQVYDTVEPLI